MKQWKRQAPWKSQGPPIRLSTDDEGLAQRIFEEEKATPLFPEAKRPNTPELKLMSAVLEQAVEDAGSKNQLNRASSRAWFLMFERSWLYGFGTIADALERPAIDFRTACLVEADAGYKRHHRDFGAPKKVTIGVEPKSRAPRSRAREARAA